MFTVQKDCVEFCLKDCETLDVILMTMLVFVFMMIQKLF